MSALHLNRPTPAMANTVELAKAAYCKALKPAPDLESLDRIVYNKHAKA
ncbi:hypothetical protein [Methylomonas albis]|nr:hypothetical protein [Methylomonas albis]